MDLMYVAVVIAFFGVTLGLVKLCATLGGGK